MALGINIVNGCGFSRIVRSEFLPQKPNNTLLSIHLTVEDILPVVHCYQDGALQL